jgi:hypothetical protein
LHCTRGHILVRTPVAREIERDWLACCWSVGAHSGRRILGQGKGWSSPSSNRNRIAHHGSFQPGQPDQCGAGSQSLSELLARGPETLAVARLPGALAVLPTTQLTPDHAAVCASSPGTPFTGGLGELPKQRCHSTSDAFALRPWTVSISAESVAEPRGHAP